MIELLISILGTLCAAGIKIACEQYFKHRYEDEIREEVDGWYSYLPGFLRKKREARYVRLRKTTGVLDSDDDSESSDDESSLSSITSSSSSSHEHGRVGECSVKEMEEGVIRESVGGGKVEDNGEDREDVSDSEDCETQSLLTEKDQQKSISVVISPPESVYYDTKSSSYSHEYECEQDLKNHNLEN